MQERYLGDSHDFLKYAILRGIAADVTRRIGLNWYLTSPNNVESGLNKHGEKRHHLSRPEWREWDSELLVALERYADPVDRNIAHFQQSGTLPVETVFFAEEVPGSHGQRLEWKQRSHTSFAETDVVFLDPDNGLEVASMTPKTAPKYAFYDEVSALRRLGKAVICIQFARQTDPLKRAHETREKLCLDFSEDRSFPVLRGRVAPNILFLTMAPLPIRIQIEHCFAELVRRSRGKLELIP